MASAAPDRSPSVVKLTAIGICLALAAAPEPASTVFVQAREFTLAWEHSIEKTRWEEDYAVVQRRGQVRLQAKTARVQGSGAGMEPPLDAVRRQQWYEYQPNPWPAAPLRLTRSTYTNDYEWCMHEHCRPLSSWLESDGDVTLLWPCERPQMADH